MLDSKDNNTPVLNYPRLGKRTFMLLALKRMGVFFFFVAVGIILLVTLKWFSLLSSIIFSKIVGSLSVVGLIVLGVSLGLAWLEYIHYSISVNDGDVKVKKGLLSESEAGFPYRKIKEVTLVRTLIDQLWGVSKVIIVVSGEESVSPTVVEMPFLRRDIAVLIRDEILERTQVEDIHISSSGVFANLKS